MFNTLKKRFSNTTLRKKVVLLMAGVACLTPIVLFAIFASLYYYYGINSLLNVKVKDAISETVHVAELYLQEHKKNIEIDLLEIANGIDLNYLTLIENPEWFNLFVEKQVEFRNLSEVIIFTKDRIIAKNRLSMSLQFDMWPNPLADRVYDSRTAIEKLEQSNTGTAVLETEDLEKVRAIMRLNNFQEDTYLMVGRYIDPNIVNHLRKTRGSATQYEKLLKDLSNTQFKLQVILITASATIWIISIFVGIKLARLISDPINHLVEATASIVAGNISVKVPEKEGKDETAKLARSFNIMTAKLYDQQNKLINANQVIAERSNFIEAVLADITAGVLVASAEYKVQLWNHSLLSILGKEEIKYGQPIEELLEGLLPLLQEYLDSKVDILQRNLTIYRGGEKLHLSLNIGKLIYNHILKGYIITFDNITELVSAQRAAAWSEVAKRLAHEIKNPLTPIQLAAERIEKKYSGLIKKDDRIFHKYINTIIKHVGDVEGMVEDFVSFARLPAPKMEVHDINALIEELIFSQQTAFPKIQYKFDKIKESCYVQCDKRQIAQVFLNLLKNAAESIEQKSLNQGVKGNTIGTISVKLKSKPKTVKINISDSGTGISPSLLDKLLEPYVTTKEKGTGLGLTIVNKILNDHYTNLTIRNTSVGAQVEFELRRVETNYANTA